MQAEPQIGTQVAGYRIESLIGRGGMSAVYLAQDLRLGRNVALKFLSADLARDERFRERFIRESKLAASLDHPNIVPIFEAGEADGLLFIAMRNVEGSDLKSTIQEEGPLEPDRATHILAQVARALDAAHARGLVHRDVKPANILVARPSDPGSPPHVYLTDFGLTKRASSDSGLTGIGQFVGTLDYAAPEQFEGKPLDARTDVYSLGCVLYECLTGLPPFQRDQDAAVMYAHLFSPPPSIKEKNRDLPLSLDSVVAKAMAKKPDDRYRSCGELISAARGAAPPPAPRVPVIAPPQPDIRPPTKRPRFRLRLPILAAAAVAILAGVPIVYLVTQSRGGARPQPPAAAVAGKLIRLDPSTGRVVARLPIGRSGDAIAVGERSVWVADTADNKVVRIDPSTSRVIATLHISGPRGIATGEGAVWVVASDLWEIDPVTNGIVTTVPLAGLPSGSVATGFGAVWVGLDITVARVDPFTGSIRRLDRDLGLNPQIAVGDREVWTAAGALSASSPGFLERVQPSTLDVVAVPITDTISDLTTGPGDVWVISHNGAVDRIDQSSRKVTRFSVGGGASSVAVGDGFVWVANSTDGTISRINPKTNSVDRRITVGKGATDLAVGDGSVWVTFSGG
jgi:streptogramin lyase